MAEAAILTVVGLGPGDPELVTVKGVRAIESAEVIFVPRSTDEADSVALRIAGPWLTGPQAVVPVTTPMTRDAEALRSAWAGIAAEIAGRLAEGGRGAYLLLGDPLLYGTFTYIAEILAAKYPFIAVEFVPGITSFAAGAARTRTPLTMTSDRLAIIPASRETDITVLRRLLADFATLILMKAGPVFPQLMAALEELGLVEQAVYVERIGLPEERIIQGGALRQMERTRQPYLSLMIVRRGEATLPESLPASRGRPRRAAGVPDQPVASGGAAGGGGRRGGGGRTQGAGLAGGAGRHRVNQPGGHAATASLGRGRGNRLAATGLPIGRFGRGDPGLRRHQQSGGQRPGGPRGGGVEPAAQHRRCAGGGEFLPAGSASPGGGDGGGQHLRRKPAPGGGAAGSVGGVVGG